MSLKLGAITFDCADARKTAAFWSAALGRPIDDGATDDVVCIGHGSDLAWYFQRVPEPKTAKTGRIRISCPTICEPRSPASSASARPTWPTTTGETTCTGAVCSTLRATSSTSPSGEPATVDPTDALHAARSALAETAERVAELVASLPESTAPIRPGTWTVRDCAVHLAVEAEGCIELARGAPAPYVYSDAAQFNVEGAAKIADNPESDPRKLAGLLGDAAERLLDASANRAGNQSVDFWGIPQDLSRLVALELGEFVMHGYDIAKAVGRPWPIEPSIAHLALYGYAPCFHLCVASDIGRHTAGYLIEVRDGPEMVMRFTDGVLSIEPPGGPVDASLSVDAAGFLFAVFGRISLWDAIALRMITVGGPQPELALGFFDRFDIP